MNSQIFRMGLAAALFLGLAACATAPTSKEEVREPSNIGGVNYNRGSYVCADTEKGLTSSFTFGAKSASFDLKGEAIELVCDSASLADSKTIAMFDAYKKYGDICTGSSKKGQVLTANSNSMGLVQVSAMRLDAKGKKTASALLNCEAGKAKKSDGW